jgi:hypothetical protein
LVGWWTANVVPLQRRDRLLVFLGGILPDLDGLGILVSLEAYFTYHHVLCHNLFACLTWVALVGLLAKQRLVCATQAFLNWHLHLACDYFGSRGPAGSPPWVLPYLYPAVGSRSGTELTGPSWYWNRWQWPLNAWPNLVVTLLGVLTFLYIAVRLNRTWLEFLWARMDPWCCQALRNVLHIPCTVGWSRAEADWARRSYLAITVGALLACVVAAGTS